MKKKEDPPKGYDSNPGVKPPRHEHEALSSQESGSDGSSVHISKMEIIYE